MARNHTSPVSALLAILLPAFLILSPTASAAGGDTVLLPVKTIRISIHVFQKDDGTGNFSESNNEQVQFLSDLQRWVNHRLANLDTLRPAVSSPFVGDARVQIRTDSVFYHRDSHAWDCSVEIDAGYMREAYVDGDTTLGYKQKYQTLPVFIGGNNPVAGGNSMNIGERGFVAVRGYFESYTNKPLNEAIDECGRNMLHELCHCLGLSHNFTGGPAGDQCDECADNGCPQEGTSNNIMDYWPSYGYALSLCQFNLIHFFLEGGKGNISETVINDSCYWIPGETVHVKDGITMHVDSLTYIHGGMVIGAGGRLRVTGYLSVPGDVSIVLESGSVLEIDGGTIGNRCGDLWQGIVAYASEDSRPAIINLINGGTVENARLGISISGKVTYNFTGGVFRNCEESAVLEAKPADTVRISDCSFVITSKLNHYEAGVTPAGFLRVKGSPALEVIGSTFVNEPATMVFDADWMGTGIITDCGRIRVEGCHFMNLTCGLDLSSGDTEAALVFKNNELIHNRYGVKSLFTGMQRYEGNAVILQRYNTGPTVGFCLAYPGRFSLSGNRFSSVFGGGKMAGIVLLSPSQDNSPLFGNSFSNLPIGLFVDNPPSADQSLFRWSANRDSLPMLGPQLRYSWYDRVPLKIAVVTDSVYGSAFGTPDEIRKEFSLPASGWRPGGYAWYSWDIPMAAFRGWKDVPVKFPDHGLWSFMNFPALGDSAPDQTDTKSVAELAAYLGKLEGMTTSEEWINGKDISQIISVLNEVPAALRSPRMAPLLERIGGEREEWLAESFAGIAARFNRADSLLARFGTSLAAMNLITWNETQGRYSGNPRRPDSLRSFPPFVFPDLTAFRFLRSARAPVIPGFSVFPNPAEGYVVVKPSKEQAFRVPWQGAIFTSEGRVAKTFSIAGWQEQKISLAGLPAGMYIMEIFAGNEYLGCRKFIKTTPF